MRSILIPLAALLVGAGGCGSPKPLDMATTPEAARGALTTVLDAWQGGETVQALAGRSPPLNLGDADFIRGAKLTSYKIEGEPKVVGTGLSYVVTLNVQDGPKQATRKVAYRVVTSPNTSVTREDGMP